MSDDLVRRVRELARHVETLERDRDDWKRDAEMHRRAWVRELGGVIWRKHHEIDGLVLTTRAMRDAAEAHDPDWLETALRDHDRRHGRRA